MYNKTRKKHITLQWEQQSKTNQQQQLSRRLRTTNLYGKQYSGNVSIDAFDNNTRLEK